MYPFLLRKPSNCIRGTSPEGNSPHHKVLTRPFLWLVGSLFPSLISIFCVTQKITGIVFISMSGVKLHFEGKKHHMALKTPKSGD